MAIAPFKAGPDYLDPMLHAVAAGRPSWNLDGWFLDEEGLREAFARGSQGADFALVEGVMGLFDGADPVTFVGSSADLARRLGLPVVLVLDGSGMGGSIAATVLGHQRLWPELPLAGVILNRLGGEGHYALQRAAIAAHTGVPVLGWVPPLKAWHLPERHLGIFRPSELPDLEGHLDALVERLASTLDLEALRSLGRAPQAACIQTSHSQSELPVALAHDEAFCFTYADTLDRLERLGVRWVPFSPLREGLPEGVAGLYLPGGYPELHATTLAQNAAFFAQLRTAHAAGMPIFAECGGYMLLAEALVDLEGRAHAMAGLLPGRTRMTEGLQDFGYQQLHLLQDTLLGPAGISLRAHSFHHSHWEGSQPSPAWEVENLQGRRRSEGHAQGKLLAGYAHLHFGAQPGSAEAWVAGMNRWQLDRCNATV